MRVLGVAFVSLLVAHELAPASSLPCSPDVSETSWVVEDAAGASALASATNCSDGVFDVEWRGLVEFPSTLFITDGSSLNITGADSSAVANGGERTQFLFAVDSTVHVSGLRIENCSATLGGAVFANRSVLAFNETSFSGNSAGYDGGALAARDSSVSWNGETSFSGNIAIIGDGGAVAIWDSSMFWSGETSFSTNNAISVNSSGGAVCTHMGRTCPGVGKRPSLGTSEGYMGEPCR